MNLNHYIKVDTNKFDKFVMNIDYIRNKLIPYAAELLVILVSKFEEPIFLTANLEKPKKNSKLYC